MDSMEDQQAKLPPPPYLIIHRVSNCDSSAMVIDLPGLADPEDVHPSIEQNLCKGDQLDKYEPNINHLDIGGGWQALGHTDEQCGQHQEGGQVHCHCSFEKIIFEEVCSIDYTKDEEGWEVNCEDCIIDPSFENYFDMDTFLWVV